MKVSRRHFLNSSVKYATTAMVGSAVLPYCTNNNPWQLGIFTRPWREYDYPSALDAIAKAGFKYVGLMSIKSETGRVLDLNTTPDEAQKIGEQANERGLDIISAYIGNFGVKESVQAGIQNLQKIIDLMSICNGQTILLGGTGDASVYNDYYKVVKECCAYAADKNIQMVIKPHGGLNATGPQCKKTVEMVGCDNFNIWYDPGNIFYYSNGDLNPVNDAPSVAGLVTGMCVKDYKHPKNVAVTPGTGLVDFPTVFDKLIKGGFKGGPLVIETLEPGDMEHLIREAKKAKSMLQGILG